MRPIILLFFALVAAGLSGGAAAQSANMITGQRLAATCANCHGTNGNTVGGTLTPLAGMRQESIVASMQAFKNGSRPATVMHQLAKGYTDEQIQLIAAHFAAQKP